MLLAIHQPSLDAGEVVGYEVHAQEKDGAERQETRRDTGEVMGNQEGKAFQESCIPRGAKGAEVACRVIVESTPQLQKNGVKKVLVRTGER